MSHIFVPNISIVALIAIVSFPFLFYESEITPTASRFEGHKKSVKDPLNALFIAFSPKFER
jgi:hypothetical protein